MLLGSAGTWAPRSWLCAAHREDMLPSAVTVGLSALRLDGCATRGGCWADVNGQFGKSRGKRRKKKTQSLKQPIKESASGEVMQSPF